MRQGLRLLRSVPYEPARAALLQVREWLRTGPRWFAATVPTMVDYPLEERLGDVVGPLVLARGRRDRVASVDYVARLAARVPGAPVVQVPGAGHIAMFRSPWYVAEAALRLADQSAPGCIGPLPGEQQTTSATAGRAPVLRRAVWRVWDLGFVLREEVAVFARPDRERLRAPERPRLPPVVLVPGVYEHWTVLRRAATVLHAAGHPVHVLPELRNNRAPIADGADILVRFLARTGLTGVVVVAHSKGGLIGKLALVGQGEQGRLAGVVAVATPFAGSARARRFPLAAVRAFAPNDSLIRSLAAERAADARIVSIYSWYDPHIPTGSRLDGAAANVELATPGHFRVLADPALPSVLVRAVRLVGAVPRRDTAAKSNEDHGHEHREL